MGLTEQDVANSVLLSLSGSGQVQPAYWLDPTYRHPISDQRPRAGIRAWIPWRRSNRLPISAGQPGQGNGQVLANRRHHDAHQRCRRCSRITMSLPVIDVFGGVSGRDLGGVLHDIAAAD